MDYIESKNNNLIKELRKLSKKRGRIKAGQFLVEGFRFVEEALKSDFNIDSILVSEESEDKYKALIEKYPLGDNVKEYKVEPRLFNTLTETETPQGVVAVVEFKQDEFKITEGVYVLADRIQDPGNLGTIIRTAHACGFNGVILNKGTVDVYNGKTLRSTMGSIFNIPIIESDDLSIVDSMINNGYDFIVSTLDEATDFYETKFNENLILAISNEGNGADEAVLARATKRVKIPMPGGAESLNAGVAGSVMMYEILRQKR